ncbi:MAG TPA: exonuclease domain-containing protein, partial [Thermoleophilaceae bacterium]|nr:exonuclease domain-containing protein [Thermoleophilaceae bacterium]
LQRGIQRFTGITQAMASSAPEPEQVLPRLARMLEGRVLVAHNAQFDRRALRQAFERIGLKWPRPPVICTVSMGRRFAPLVRERKLAALAESLGIEVHEVHRALPDATTCAQILCALLPRMCAAAPTIEEAVEYLQPRRRGSSEILARKIAKEERPDLSALPSDPGVYIFRNDAGQPLYVGKSVSLRSRARAHFCAPSGWTERAAIVDYRSTCSELGALVLENRLIKEWRPSGNKALKRTDQWAFIRCRLDIEYPVLEAAADPAAGHAINVGPIKGLRTAQDIADQLTSMFRLRHCGRRLHIREHPSAYGQMGRCCSPCLGDLDPNAYRRQVEKAFSVFWSADARAALLAELDEQMRDAARAQRYERAGALVRRKERLDRLLWRTEGMLEAMHARPRLVLASHPAKPLWDAFWVVAGRVVDWGALPAEPSEIAARTTSAMAHASRSARPGSAADVPAAEVDEVRIVASWVARNEPPALEIGDPAAAAAWALSVTAAPDAVALAG